MGDYCTPLRGIMEIMPTEGQIMCPEGCIMPQRDAVDRRSRHPDQQPLLVTGSVTGGTSFAGGAALVVDY